MSAYIVDTKTNTVVSTYPDSSFASFAMSDNYAWDPDNRYIMLHDDEAAWDYWQDWYEMNGKYEDFRCFNAQVDMFNDWLKG